LRLVLASGGGWLGFRLLGDFNGVFAALALALGAFGAINAAAIYAGAWRPRAPFMA
jgi:hypothetical protein